MECVVQVVRGQKLDIKNVTCSFCGTDQTTSIFCITKETKYDGTLLQCFGICKEHLDRLNALMSGEFNIDDIFIEKYRIKHGTKLNLRRFPAAVIAKTDNNKTWKQCEFTGCINKFYGIANQKYCTDERCKQLRKEYFKTVPRTKLMDPDSKNIILSTRHKRKLKSGQSLKIRCHAITSQNIRCKNTYFITFDLKQSTYPMFCECHRSAYKRQRFLLQKG